MPDFDPNQQDVNIPGGDVPFSDLFRADGNPQPTTADPADPAASTPAQPQTAPEPTPQSFELRTKTGTIYKSIEDAVSGIEHKDTLISQLRQFAIERTGFDPVTGQQMTLPQQQMQQPQMQQMPHGMQPQQDRSYLQNPQAYFEDLYKAYETNDPNQYFAVQQRLIEERMMAEFQPFMPVLSEFAKTTAVQRVSGDVPEFGKFYGSENYRATLAANPALAQAIAVSEQNPQMANQLGDLYKMVYQLDQVRRLPELIKQQTQSAPSQPVPPARPTTTPQTAAPSHQGPRIDPRTANLTDADTRKSIIDQFEKSGKADVVWKG